MEVNGDENGLNRDNEPPAPERRNPPRQVPQEMELEQEVQDEDMPLHPELPRRPSRVRNPVVEFVLEVNPNKVQEEEQPMPRKRRKLQRETRRGRIRRRERLSSTRGNPHDLAVPGPSGLPPPRTTRRQPSTRRHSSSESD